MKKPLLLALLVCSISFSFSQTAEEYNDMAIKKTESKDYQYAMGLINKAIALDPKNQWYYLRKAEIQFELTGPMDAIEIVRSAIAIDKKESEPYNRAGGYYSSSGMGDSAITMYNRAIRYAENDTMKFTYIMNRGTAKSAIRDFEGAVKDFEEVLAYNPVDIAALNNVAACYDEVGLPNKTILTLKKLLALDPTFLGSYINLGFAYSNMDSLDLAISYFNKAVELDPNEGVIYNNRGYVYYRKGDLTNALKDINYSIKLYPTNSYAYRNLGLVYIAMNKTTEACAALNYAKDSGFEQRYGPEVGELIRKHCKK
ncbi:MAG TPA: tetratricopeptide repeat protein [Bacteroidia bacterium]|jgi:tetratricopeptide (TPR) repeat protein